MKPVSAAPEIPDSRRLRYHLMDGRDAHDRELIFAIDQDPEVMRFLNHGEPTSREEFDTFVLPRFASFTNPALGHGIWGFADKHSGESLGWILVRHYRFDRAEREADNIELGWRLKRAYWNRGLTTEAARAIMNVLQQDPAIRVFSALADSDNLASIGVMRKLGMQFVEKRVHIVDENRRYPAAYYELPSPNFKGLSSPPPV